MNSEQQMIACPSCGKRYNLSDFKEDKLVCSACGREIPRFLSVESVDEAKYVKQYLNRACNVDYIYIGLPLSGLLYLWLLTLNISFWWKILIFFVIILTQVGFFKEYRKHRQVRKIFKQNNYRLLESGICFKIWYDGLSEDEKSDVPDCYKESFVEDLENYVKSHAELKRDYGQTGNAQSATDIAPYEQTYRFAIPKELQVCDEYDYPPERCPGCGKLYEAADFSTDNVQCRYCGKQIRIKCRVSDEDMKRLHVNLYQKIKKARRSSQKVSVILFLIMTVIICLQMKAAGVYRYFSTWHVVTMFFYLPFLLGPFLGQEERKMMYLLKQDDINILSVEIYIKRLAGNKSDISNEEKAIAEFKKNLFDLYRIKGKVIGRY